MQMLTSASILSMGDIMRVLSNCFKQLVAWSFERYGPIRVLFSVVNEIGFLNQEPIIRLMVTDPRFLVGIVQEEEAALAFSSDATLSLFSKHQVSKLKAQKSIWHYVLATDVLDLWLRWPAIGVYLGHGSAFGNEGVQEASVPYTQKVVQRSNISIMILEGSGAIFGLRDFTPDLLQVWEKAFFVSGPPKLASLLEDSVDRAQNLLALDLNPDASTILVASHWTEMSLLRDIDLGFLESIVREKPHINVIATCHPRLLMLKPSDGFDSVNLLKVLSRLDAKYENFAFVQTGNPFSLMQVSDCMLCDHSSIRVEYALLKKPAGLYRNPNFRCDMETTDRLYREASEVFSHGNELNTLIERLLSDDYDKRSESERLAEYFIASPVGSAQRIVDLFAQLGRISSTKSKNWTRVKNLEEDWNEGGF
jgi:hypothetical protein